MNKEVFIKECSKLGINITEDILNKLDNLYKIMIETNEHLNLTRITDYEEVYLKHYYDSLTIAKVVNLNEVKTLCDIGTGAGFPGLVLKIVYPHLEVTLVDSLNKRIVYLEETIKKLGLTNIKCIHERGENLNMRDYFDVVTTRAVASLPIISEICLPLTKVHGFFIPMKGHLEEEEIELGTRAIKVLNSNIIKKEEFNLYNDTDFRTLLLVERVGNIPNKYPRSIDKMKNIKL